MASSCHEHITPRADRLLPSREKPTILLISFRHPAGYAVFILHSPPHKPIPYYRSVQDRQPTSRRITADNPGLSARRNP